MVDDPFGMSGKAVLIVGGGQGIGQSTALRFSEAGCDIAIVDVDENRAADVARLVRLAGRRACTVVADALDPEQATKIVDQARRQLGRLDCMVTVIGQALFRKALDLTPQEWDLDHRRNLRYVFFLAQRFAQDLIAEKRSGSIVCIASSSGVQAAVNQAAYGAAKAGLLNLVKTLAVEWAIHGIRVNAVTPGAIVTPRIPDSSKRQEEFAAGPVPMRRRGTTDEIAHAALFLASDMASYVTGDTLNVDGGLLAANLLLRPGALA